MTKPLATPAGRTPWQRTGFHLLLILLCGAVIYSNSLPAPFYFDDYPCIVHNPVVQHFSLLGELARFRELGIDEDIRNSLVARVVAYATFALNHRLHGFNPAGFRLVNLAIHLCNALLIYALVRMTVGRFRIACARPPTAGQGLALAVALLFVAHPLQTNAVTYIVQRFASLATFFCLVALLAYRDAVLSPDRRRQSLSYAVALCSTILAMFTKEIAFTLPLLIVLYDLAFLPGERRRRWQRLAPLCATMCLLPLAIATLASRSLVTGGAIAHSLDLMNLGHTSRWEYFLAQGQVLLLYLRLLFVPTGLNLEHDLPLQGALTPEHLGAGLVLALLLGFGLYLLLRPLRDRRREREPWRLVGFGIVWFFVTIAMESSIITLVDVMQEYRVYLPSFGIFLAVAAALDILRQRLAERYPLTRAIVLAGTVLIVLALGAATVARNQLWRNAEAFWQDAIAKSPAKARPQISLATVYFERHQPAAALSQAQQASRAGGHTRDTRLQLALLYKRLGMDELAIREMLEVVRFAPEQADAYGLLGDLYRQAGRTAEAAAAFRTALRLDPEGPWNDRETLQESESTPSAPNRATPPPLSP